MFYSYLACQVNPLLQASHSRVISPERGLPLGREDGA